jgi:hypothetical protein
MQDDWSEESPASWKSSWIEDDENDDEPELSVSHEYYDLDAAAGMPIWVDEDTLEFIFSIRYNSPAFDGSLLQEDYRIMAHKAFSDLIIDLIKQKLKMMAARPDLYDMNKMRDRKYNLTTINTDNIIDIAKSMGINPTKTSVLTLVADVTSALEKIVMRSISERPGMNTADKNLAKSFLENQLWDEDAQLRWRAVHAHTLAAMYSYDALPKSIKILHHLDDYILSEMHDGSLQAANLNVTFMDAYLNDDVVLYVLERLGDPYDTRDDDMIIDEAIEDVRTGEWQDF